jgi:arabinogalactan endo-1,4-beta-galactosidase
MRIPGPLLALALSGLTCGPALARPYIIGADISWLPEDESRGSTYWDKGAQKDLLQILKEYKFNFIRLRIFVDPAAAGGYSRQGFCDLTHTLAMAKRIQAAGMNFLLDFHMSDTWASIGEQHVPASWAGKPDKEMQDSAYAHVNRSIKALVAQGTRPDMVQVGNEINSAMSGVSSSNWPRLAALINAGVKGVRDVDPTIKIAMQHGRPRADGNFLAWVDALIANKVDFDYISGSMYGTTNDGADWTDQYTKCVATSGKPVLGMEYTPAKVTMVNGVLLKLPGEKGMGAFLWEPTRYPTDGPMFDHSGTKYTTNALIEPYLKLAQDNQVTPYFPITVGLAAGTQRPAGYVFSLGEGGLSFLAPKSGPVRLSVHSLSGRLLGEWTTEARAGSNPPDARLAARLREFGPRTISLRAEGGETAYIRWAGGPVGPSR